VSSLPHHIGLHSAESVEDDGPVTSVNIEEGVIDYGTSDGQTQTNLTQSVEELRCHSQLGN